MVTRELLGKIIYGMCDILKPTEAGPVQDRIDAVLDDAERIYNRTKSPYKLPGLPNVTPVGNVGAGEDNLMSYTIPAGLMSRNGDRCEFQYALEMPGLDVNLRLYVNGEQVGETYSSVTHSRRVFVRLTATTGIVLAYDASAHSITALTGLDFTQPIVVKFTGQSNWDPPADNDIVQHYLGGEFYPA